MKLPVLGDQMMRKEKCPICNKPAKRLESPFESIDVWECQQCGRVERVIHEDGVEAYYVNGKLKALWSPTSGYVHFET